MINLANLITCLSSQKRQNIQGITCGTLTCKTTLLRPLRWSCPGSTNNLTHLLFIYLDIWLVKLVL